MLKAAAFLGLVLALGAPPPPPPLVRYTLAEARRSLTPHGERSRAVSGTVTLLGEKARWDLSGGDVFPRAQANGAVTDGRTLLLVDSRERRYARLGPEELDQLFAAPPAAPSGADVSPVSTAATVTEEGAGKPLGELPTRRYRVTLKTESRVTATGRVTTLVSETHGTIESVDLPPSPFDGLLRLFTVRGDARDALQRELGKVEGLPVRVSLETVSETRAETVGDASSPERPRSFQTKSSATRTVSDLTRRVSAKQDPALFQVPDDFRLLGPERLLAQDSVLP